MFTHILQTSVSGQMLMKAVDKIQLTEVWGAEDSRTQGQLSRQYVDNPPEEKQGRQQSSSIIKHQI